MPLERTAISAFRSAATILILLVAVLVFGLSRAAALSSAPAAPIGSAPPAPGPPIVQPDVQVLIVPSAGGDMIDLTYPGVVPPAQAERDVTAILHAGGWHTTDVDISDASLPITGRNVKMTSVTFQVTGATPTAGVATLRLEPWIVGLRPYINLAVAYLMPPDFRFSGLRSYQDSHVAITLDQQRTTLTYHIRILDGGNFTGLGLPLTQPAAQPHSLPPPHRRLNVFGIIVVGLAAAGVGYAVYTLLSRLH